MARDRGVSKWIIMRMRDEGQLESRRLNRRDTVYRVLSHASGKSGPPGKNLAIAAAERDDNESQYTS